jgi:hypothetical protein
MVYSEHPVERISGCIPDRENHESSLVDRLVVAGICLEVGVVRAHSMIVFLVDVDHGVV